MKHAFEFGDSEIHSTDINELLAEYLSEYEDLRYQLDCLELERDELIEKEDPTLEFDINCLDLQARNVSEEISDLICDSDFEGLKMFVDGCKSLNSQWSEGVTIYNDEHLEDDRDNYHEVSIHGYTYWLPKEQ